jgi:Zn-dependent M28 family amino/carboxypeptidase
VSREAYAATVEALVAGGTRYSSSAEFGTAALWAKAVLTGLDYEVRLDPVALRDGNTVNVVADKKATSAGSDDDPRQVHVVAHLDSVNIAGGPGAPAPGADDNASGAAGVIEIARVLSTARCAHDLRLVLFGGEEQGLFGSQQYVEEMSAAERARTTAVVNMDMIARLNAEPRSVLLEGDEVSQPLIDSLAGAAAAHTDLDVFTSLDPFASDHVPFIEAGMPAVLTIEGSDQLNTDEHTERDTQETLDLDLAVAILRMNVAALAAALEASPATGNGVGSLEP